MNTYAKAMLAGFAATAALSVLMVMKAAMGLMLTLNVISMLSYMAQQMLGLGEMWFGWLMHFLIGTVLWGGLYALSFNKLPTSSPVGKAVVFAVGAWLLMMIMAMPMAGAGLFGLKLGMMAPIMTLVLHIIWGLVLGSIFSVLSSRTVDHINATSDQ
ncbi:DUF6789 family protein [Thalassospira xiamenensis]|uniref:Uncharacterized protein n=1 Tax=Thalassospira xiamenensis TaxID=220697 RepID=A0A285TY30_9PROT|nr:DUF6789 family protein [Thalassospira xiamenensis]SOC31039.1 hypothetical protein SAMN05428964_11217 [Thalassospira xiamenensis]